MKTEKRTSLKPLIIVCDRFSAEGTAWLKSHSGHEVIHLPEVQTVAELETAVGNLPNNQLSDIEGLIGRTKLKITKDFLAKVPNLKGFVTATVGFDHIDLEACADRKVAIAHCPDSHSASAAELTWALVLACAKKLRAAEATARTQTWNREPLLGWQLDGKTHGIFGLGRIGARVARMAQGFGMRVVAHDPYRNNQWFEKHGCERVGVDELFHMSDTVSLHVPMTRETKGRIHRIHFDLLKPDSIIVNTSRGGVLKEEDLVLHLKNKGPGTFGLDVFNYEPLKVDSELLKFPQVVLTPHIGATTHEAFKAVSMEAAKNLMGLLRNQAVSGPLPPPEEWFKAVSELAGTSPF